MELNGVGLSNMYSEISGTGLNPPVQGDENYSRYTGHKESLDISRPGKIMNTISQLSEEEKTEMKTFHDEVMEAINNGTFDASELAKNAPELLVKLSEETGIDLEQMIGNMAAGPQAANGAPPPPPMMGGMGGPGGNSELSDEEKDEIDAFMESLLESVNNGTFDASKLAANAPQSLVKLSENTGANLEQIIEDIASGTQEGKGTPPPPPEMYNSKGIGLSFDSEENNDLLGFLLSDDSDEIEQV